MMRAALGVAALIGASSACPFTECAEGCTTSWPVTDESVTATAECVSVGQEFDLMLPLVNFCHVNVYNLLETPNVCGEIPDESELFTSVNKYRMKCITTGLCAVHRHMELQQHRCDCPIPCQQDSDCEGTHTCRSRLLEAAVFPEKGTCSTDKVCTRKSVLGEPCGGLVQDCETNVCDGDLSCTFNGHQPGQCYQDGA